MINIGETIKIGFIGETNVGKSTFIRLFLNKHSPPNPTYIIEVNKGFYECQDGSKVNIECWDISGQNQQKQQVQDAISYMKLMDVIVFMYDLTSQFSFINVNKWQFMLQKKAIKPDYYVLLGNKLDKVEKDPRNRKITMEKGMQKAKNIGDNGAFFKEISWKNCYSNALAQTIDHIIEDKMKSTLTKTKISINVEGREKKEDCCESCIIF